MTNEQDWHSSVYGKKEHARYTREYKVNSKKICIKDNYECQSCFKKLMQFECSVHHIDPIEEGGSDEMSNLILLCKKCHDGIEGRELSRLQITGYFYQSTKQYSKPCWPADWHLWVYGSDENPINDSLFMKLKEKGELVRIGNFWWKKRLVSPKYYS